MATYPTVCEDCNELFEAKSNKAFYCPKCVKKRLSNSAKRRELNMIGANAYSERRKKMREEETNDNTGRLRKA